MTLAAVRRVLDERVGLDPDTLGPTTFPTAVAERCRLLGIADATGYAERITRDSAEFDALLSKLVVPETWFFRGSVFEAISRRAVEHRLERPDRPFRVLSVPCSTGEEPFSLAMALLDSGLVSVGAWTIDGVDVSPAAVSVANRGVYRELSFRQTPAEVRARYFRKVGDGWELDAGVRARVRFRVGNVLAPTAFAAELGLYDVILCRNLLIYLTVDGRRRVVDLLETLLVPGGWLAVGHAEPAILDGRRFGPVGPDGSFLFAKGAPPRSERIPMPAPRSTPIPREVAPSAVSPGWPPVRIDPPQSLPVPLSPSPPASPSAPVQLTRCRELADTGQLSAARQECESSLAANPTADGYALLGVILQASGNLDGAAEALRKALYLDPTHREALMHAELVSRSRGQFAAADAFRARLARIPGGET